jgi:hypothetical protein
MRRLASICCIMAVLGCGGGDDTPDVAADSVPSATPAPALSIADVTGTWTVDVMPEASDSVLLTYTMNAPADTAAWTIKFPDRAEPVPLKILSIAGDSMVTHAGPYSSALRKGVTVETHAVTRIENGVMVGRNVATYSKGPDSVLVLRSRGTRSQ